MDGCSNRLMTHFDCQFFLVLPILMQPTFTLLENWLFKGQSLSTPPLISFNLFYSSLVGFTMTPRKEEKSTKSGRSRYLRYN